MRTLVLVLALVACADAAGPVALWGDVDDDGRVTQADADEVARYTVGLPVGNAGLVLERGDVTADGQVNVIDAQQIARYAAGLPVTTRVGQPIS